MGDERRLHSVTPLKVDQAELDRLRALFDEALHSYVVAATGYNLHRAMVIFNRVRTTLNGQISGLDDRGPGGRAA